MRDEFVDHHAVRRFAEERVNLRQADVSEFRAQVRRLREKMAKFIEEHPGVGLDRMILSGSLAKGTALKSLNDIDVALHVTSPEAPEGEAELLDWLVGKLREAYPQMDDSQFSLGNHCVKISFRGSGLDVDVVPIYEVEDDSLGRGYLYARSTGERVLTSIPLHLKFVRKRKEQAGKHYAQMIRLVKWWARQRKAADANFRCKSFLLEMLMARQLDAGADLTNYPDALEEFFTYVVTSGLKGQVFFTDYIPAADIPARGPAPVEVLDPVNVDNSIVSDYSEMERSALVDAAEEALDAVSEARYATTKGRSVACWRDIFGPSFTG